MHTKLEFTKTLENQIEKLYKDLKSHRYQPSPVKTAHIPKPNGGKRPLSISSVRDKIVQAAVRNPLEEVYEPLFSEVSYGFRPKKKLPLRFKAD